MKKEDFENLNTVVRRYEALRNEKEKMCELQKYLEDTDIEFITLNVSGTSFRGGSFDVKRFRENLLYMCEAQIINLERDMEEL